MHYLYFCLWITPHLLLAFIVVAFVSKQITKLIPFFFLFLVAEICFFVAGMASYLWVVSFHHPGAYPWYHEINLFGTGLSAVLQLGALYELATELLFSRPSLAPSLRSVFRWSAAVLVLTAAGLSATLSQSSLLRVLNILATLDFCVSFLKIGLLLVLLVCTRLLHISWKTLLAGIALGFGVWSSVELGASVLLPVLGSPAFLPIDYVRMAGFQLCTLIWLIYVIRDSGSPISGRSSLSVSELEILSKQTEKMIR